MRFRRRGAADGAPQRNATEILANALGEVAGRRACSPAARPEAHLVAVVRAALGDAATVVAGEPRYELPGWTRRPGGVDLACDHGGRRILVECKVDKPDEALWDALKLADILRQHDVEAAYLLHDATDVIWHDHPVATLFTGPIQRWKVRDLIARWPKAWGDLLYGGRGIRPRESVAALDVEPAAAVALTPARTARLLRITPVRSRHRQHFDDDGWPTGYEPPRNLRIASRFVATTGPPPGDLCETCHGHPWYSRFSQTRLEQLVPSLDDAAYACLRRRLGTERNWTENDLRTRVDPLRRDPPRRM
jgi:hypothetical protein